MQTQTTIQPSIPVKSVKPKHTGSSTPVSIVGLIIGMLLLIGSLGGIVYFLTNLPVKAKAISQAKSQTLTTSMSSQDVALLKQALDETADDRKLLESSFPNESNLIQFISLIDKLKSSDIPVVLLSVDSDTPTKIGKNPSFLPLSLTLSGKKASVDSALQTIERSPYFIRPVTYLYRLDPSSDRVEIRTQFHLFVSDTYAKP